MAFLAVAAFGSGPWRHGAGVLALALAALVPALPANAAGPALATPPPLPEAAPASTPSLPPPVNTPPPQGAGAPTDLGDIPTTTPLAPAREVSPKTQIEQVRDNNKHVSEVIVVPAGTSIHYSLINREGQRPLSPLGTTPGGLSTQRFFRVDF